MKRVAYHNLGCKVNSYEMDAMLMELKKHGYEIVSFDEIADIYVVNTCTVTNMADRKSRQMLHKAKKMNPEGIVVAVGCYVQSDTDGVRADDAVDLMVGNNRKKDLVKIIEEYMAGATSEDVIDINHTDEYEEIKITETEEHTRAYIKIQDGCNQFCSYCMIPFARGRVRSRRPEDVISEITELTKHGYQEFVLTGIHLSSYGLDFVKEDPEKRFIYGKETNHVLLDLMKKIDEIPGVSRMRLGSLEPRVVTEEFVQGISALKSICPHFHLSLQSGSLETLKRMNRHYTPEQFLEGVEILRKYFNHPAITTDVIVGFPQESEEEFEETKQFLNKVCFYELHVFMYSKRKGTKAAVMDGQIPDQIKKIRSSELIEKDEIDSRRFREYYVNHEVEVLFEEEKNISGQTYWIGHTREYVKVALKSKENLQNKLLSGKITGLLNNEIILMEL